MGSLTRQVQDYLADIQIFLDGFDTPEPAPRGSERWTFAMRAEKVYQKMTSVKFCRRRPQAAAAFLQIIEAAMAEDLPIDCILGHGPLKNQNNCQAPVADWAEYFSYVQLLRLAKAVKAIYPPGLRITFFVDDARSQYANAIDPGIMVAYRHSVEAIVSLPPFNRVIHQVVSLQTLYQSFNHAAYLPEAALAIDAWMADPKNHDALMTMYEHAHRNLVFSDDTPLEVRQAEVVAATRRYLVGYEAEKRCGIWQQPNHLYMRYSPHEGFYQIFTLRKGSVSQPWQGQGALLLTPHGKLDPTIVTRSKRSRMTELAVVKTGMPLSGLSTLPVVTEGTATEVLPAQTVSPGMTRPVALAAV